MFFLEAGKTMIEDIMSRNFARFGHLDTVEKVLEVIGQHERIIYIVVDMPDNRFAIIETKQAKEAIKKIGEKVGRSARAIPLASVSEFTRVCECVDIAESEQIARSKARKSPGKMAVVIERNDVVGVIKEPGRNVLFGGVPSTLYGERYDIFEKGTVAPKYELSCPNCDHSFSFYEPRIEAGKVLYCCPICKQVLED